MPVMNLVSGWLLSRVLEIDEGSPGLAGAVFRCSAERRQVVAAYLSLARPDQEFEDMAALGSFLIKARHEEILRAAFGSVPAGMRGALRRAGSRTHPRRFYGYLYHILATNSREATRALIPHLPKVSPSLLQTSRALPSDLQSPALVSALRNSVAARDVARLVDQLERAGVDRAPMCRALSAAKKMEAVIAFAGTWAFRATLPAHPVPHTDFYTPIQQGSELKRLAFSYRNCLRSMLANVLDGRSAFAVIRDAGAEAVVHLVNHRGAWQLLEVCGQNNAAPTAGLRAKAASYLRCHGVEQRKRFHSEASKWQPLRRLLGRELNQMEMDEILL